MSLKHTLIKHWVLHKEYRDYCQALSEIHASSSPAGPVVIVPCAPDTVIGSRGDEAMIVATLQNISYNRAYIVTSSGFTHAGFDEIATKYGATALPVWEGPCPVKRVASAIAALSPSKVFILGADCMDGHYSPFISFELLSLYAILTRKGLNATLLGCSFNSHPDSVLLPYFRKVGRHLHFNLRDPKSLVRFKSAVRKGNSTLVADTAFSLKPDADSEAVTRYARWIDSMHQQGHPIVLAFNFHPMLRSNSDPVILNKDAEAVAANLSTLLHRHPEVAVALVPHDDRNRISDNTVLEIVARKLADAGLSDRIHYRPFVPRAAQLKTIAGLFQGVISSRMHFAIASLGMGIPVMAADYQDKFEGLFEHFALPKNYILSPSDFCNSKFLDTAELFINNLDALRATVQKNLPTVMSLSAANFNPA